MILEVICQLSRDVIGYERLIMSLVCFDPSSVTVKLLFIVSQIVGCHSLTTTYFLDGDVFKSLIPYLGNKNFHPFDWTAKKLQHDSKQIR